MRLVAKLLLVAVLLGGCAVVGLPRAERAPVPLVAVEGRVEPRVDTGYRVKSLITPNDLTALNAASSTIEVYIQRFSDAGRTTSETSQTKLGTMAGSSRKIVLRNLWPDRWYRVTLRAFKADPNDASQSLQMTNDVDNVTDFDTQPISGQYDASRTVTFALELTDQVFSGDTATSSTNVDVTPGTLTNPTDPEALASPTI